MLQAVLSPRLLSIITSWRCAERFCSCFMEAFTITYVYFTVMDARTQCLYVYQHVTGKKNKKGKWKLVFFFPPVSPFHLHPPKIHTKIDTHLYLVYTHFHHRLGYGEVKAHFLPLYTCTLPTYTPPGTQEHCSSSPSSSPRPWYNCASPQWQI